MTFHIACERLGRRQRINSFIMEGRRGSHENPRSIAISKSWYGSRDSQGTVITVYGLKVDNFCGIGLPMLFSEIAHCECVLQSGSY